MKGLTKTPLLKILLLKNWIILACSLSCARVPKTEIIATNRMGFPCSRGAWGEISCSNYLSSKRPQVNAPYLVLTFWAVYSLSTQTQTDLNASSLREMNFCHHHGYQKTAWSRVHYQINDKKYKYLPKVAIAKILLIVINVTTKVREFRNWQEC